MKAPGWFSVILFAASVATAGPKPPPSAIELTPAEEWVVAQVTAGVVADLGEEFPEEAKRKLSSNFLEDLLTGRLSDVKPHRNGVRIVGAIIGELDLTNAQISSEVWLGNCQFIGGATFLRANFERTVVFDQSTFRQYANFNGAKFGGRVVMQEATFEGLVDFVGAEVTSEFHAEDAKFVNAERGATFNTMKVGEHAFLKGARFQGPVDFGAAKIVGNFDADGAKFKNPEQTANFNGMKVGHHAFFRKAEFDGPVDFIGADIAGEFHMEEAQFRNEKKEATFDSMKVRGYAFFNQAMFEGWVNFAGADFAGLDLSSPFWPKAADQLNMQGMSYKYIRAVRGNEPESHKALLKLVDHSAYRADVYGKLEQFFSVEGYRNDADRAFIAGKRRERKEYLHGLPWLGSFLLDWLVGYGRRPWQAGIPCVGLVTLGCIVFSPKRMEPQKPDDAPRVYNRFWYSLDLFLPFINLQADDAWKPKINQRFLRHYVRLHVMLGWILIPIVLAALTGLIK